MIYWADRVLWSSACVLAGLVGLEQAVSDYSATGIASPWFWFHAVGFPAAIFGIIRSWMVR